MLLPIQPEDEVAIRFADRKLIGGSPRLPLRFAGALDSCTVNGSVTQRLDAATHLDEIARVQSLAAEYLDLDEATQARQVRYRARVEAMFDSTPTAAGGGDAP